MKKNCTAKERFTKLDLKRSTLLDCYQVYSSLTVPWVCTESGYTEENRQLQDDWSSFGHHCVTNLVNKLMLGLFSPTKPFFRLQASEEIREAVSTQEGGSAALDQVLSKYELKCQRYLEKLRLRETLIAALTNLVVIGTSLIKLDPKGYHVCYNIRQYVLRRNRYGKCIEFITCEEMEFEFLESKIQEIESLKQYAEDDKVKLFEWFVYDEDKDRWSSTMWVDEHKLPGKFDGGWKGEDFPYIALTWNLTKDAHYGNGQVQTCLGDLEAYRALCKSQTEMGMIMGEHRWLVNPGSSTDPKQIEMSPNGAVLPGREGDLSLVSLNAGSQNLQSVLAIAQDFERRLAASFLMTTAITRQAERVTAEEIRMQVRELETMLSGVYNRISNELQTPIAYFLIKNVDGEKLKVDGKDLQPIIITGSDALSRSGDVDNIAQSLQILGGLNNLPPSLLQTLNLSSINKKVFAGFGVDPNDVVLSDEQIAANQQMQMQAQMAGAEGPAPGTTPTMT